MSTAMFLILALTLPVAGVLLVVAAGGRKARGISLAVLVGNLTVAAGLGSAVWQTGRAVAYVSGGWAVPLGIQLRADGLSVVMLLTAALVLLAVGVYAPAEFTVRRGGVETRKSLTFWVLLLAVGCAMNAVFLGNDFFNLYVALELLTFAAVPLVCLTGTRATLEAALRYLLFALTGSALYLLGVALLYGNYGTLDITKLAVLIRQEPGLPLGVAVALMTAGLAAKTALFPLHLWLPPAHAGAPPSASALLSALVVKGSFFLTVRLWFDTVPELTGLGPGQMLGAMGAGAIVVGGILALRQERLKLLIAYSTVAQIGYLFLMFPLAGYSGALTGGMFQAISHAFAKASMFLGAGLMAEVAGSDRLESLRGMGRVLPLTSCAFGLAALSLVGVPPTGGFMAKWQLLSAAFSAGQWWWVVVILGGGLLAGGYMFRAVQPTISAGMLPAATIPRIREWMVLALAVCALLLGMFPQKPIELLNVGRPLLSQTQPGRP